jgi:hypothetical protein
MADTTLSLAEMRTELEEMARETQAAFGGLDARQLNWWPDATRWSVAQCHTMKRPADLDGRSAAPWR